MDESTPELNRTGNRLFAARQYAEAEKAFRELMASEPASPTGYIGLAKVMDRRQRFDDILREIEPAAERFRSPRLLRIVADTYRVLVSRGRSDLVDRAVAAHRSYHEVQLDPVTLYYLGMLLVREKSDPEQALWCFDKSWELDPSSRLAFEGVVFCLRRLFRSQEIESIKQLWRDRNGGQEPPELKAVP